MDQKYLHFLPTESAIFEGAASIFAAYVQNNQVNESNEDELIQKSVTLAIKIACQVDETVRTEGEMS